MKNNRLFKMSLTAMFLATAYVLPFLTGQIPEIGSMLCPMHIPVLLCGFLCGWQWGFAVGLIAPLLRSVTLGAPVLFPMAVSMALELAVYGTTAGLMHKKLPRKKPFIYLSLLVSMLLGRIAWGVSMLIFTGINGGTFTLTAFLTGAFANSLAGIVVQIILIPILVIVIDKERKSEGIYEK